MRIRCPNCQHSIAVLSDVADTISGVVCPSCHTEVDLADGGESTESSHPKTIAQFELIRQLGEGAFGSVWLAKDTELHREVAIKVPRKQKLSTKELELFLREARSAAQLTHQHIIGIHEVGRTKDLIYIVSDYVDGTTLAELAGQKRFTHMEAAQMCAKIADALHHAHERGIIHRDLKPGNIMIDQRGEPHIMDFGIAKQQAADTSLTVEGQILGTPAYMPPEQADGDAHRVDRRADVYSLGVILYELLTGERPFKGNLRTVLYQVIHENPLPPRKHSRSIPRDLENICLKCLEKNRRQRYDTAADLAEDLRRWIQRLPVKARPLGPVTRFLRWSQRNPALASMLGLIVVITAVGFVGVTAAWLSEAEQRELAQREQQAAIDARDLAKTSAEEAEKARDAAQKALAQAEEQRLRAEEAKAEAERFNVLLQKASEEARAQAEEAKRERQKALEESERANQALADLERSREQEQKALAAAKNAASVAYLNLSKHLEAKGDYELVMANYRAASELGIVSEEHSKLFEESLRKKFSSLDAETAPDTLPTDERELAAKSYFTYAMAARDQKDFAEAIKRLERAQKFDPNPQENKEKYDRAFQDLHIDWAKEYIVKNDYDRAIEQYQAAKSHAEDPASVNPLIADLYAVQAQGKRTHGDFTEAVRLFQQAAKLDSTSKDRFHRQIASTYADQAEQLLGQQKLIEAADAFMEAAKFVQTGSETYRNRAGSALKLAAKAAEQKGDQKQALTIYARASETDPQHRSDYLSAASDLLQTSARDKVKKGDYEQAAKDFLAAAQYDPENKQVYQSFAADALSSQAKSLLGQDPPDRESAIAVLKRAYELNAKSEQVVEMLAEAYKQRALVYYKSRDFAKASDDYTRIIQLQPNNALAFVTRGNLRLSQQDYDGALEDYGKALEIDPDNPVALRYRIDINIDLRPSKSKTVLQQTIQDLKQFIGQNKDPKYQQKYAYLLATAPYEELRDGRRAVEIARQVCEEENWKNPVSLTVLASAYAQAGDANEAVKWMQKAIDLSPNGDDAKALNELLVLYRQGQKPPYPK